MPEGGRKIPREAKRAGAKGRAFLWKRRRGWLTFSLMVGAMLGELEPRKRRLDCKKSGEGTEKASVLGDKGVGGRADAAGSSFKLVSKRKFYISGWDPLFCAPSHSVEERRWK